MGRTTTRALGAEEELHLLEAARSGDPEARQRFMEEHLDLVVEVSREMAYRFRSRVQPTELYGVAVEGLLEAMERFDPERATKGFRSFGKARIRGAILDEVRRVDTVPRSERLRARRVECAVEELSQKLGRPPTGQELAERLGMAFDNPRMARGRNLRNMVVNYSELRALNHDEVPGGLDGLVGEECPGAETTEARDAFETLLKGLTGKERIILRLYYVDGHSMREIGQHLGICESRVSQIHKNLLGRLRARFASPGHVDAAAFKEAVARYA